MCWDRDDEQWTEIARAAEEARRDRDLEAELERVETERTEEERELVRV